MRTLTIEESFFRNYRLSPEARGLYLIYRVLGKYSLEKGWDNKRKEPYIQVTEDLLRREFAFYPTVPLSSLHTELVSVNLIQVRERHENSEEISILVRYPTQEKSPSLCTEMPGVLRHSKKTIMSQWRSFSRNMLESLGDRIGPLTSYLYCDILMLCAISETKIKEIRGADFSKWDFIGYIQPVNLLAVLKKLNITMSLLQIKKSIKELQSIGAVRTCFLDKEGSPDISGKIPDERGLWKIPETRRSPKPALLICLPDTGEKDYSIFFSDPDEYHNMVEYFCRQS